MKGDYVYPVRVKKTEEGTEITFVDFPNLVTFAEKDEEIISMAQEALALTIIDLEAEGQPIPEPTMTETDVLFVPVWMPRYRSISKEIYVKKSVTIPQWLDILAKERSVNFSAALVRGLKAELGIGQED